MKHFVNHRPLNNQIPTRKRRKFQMSTSFNLFSWKPFTSRKGEDSIRSNQVF